MTIPGSKGVPPGSSLQASRRHAAGFGQLGRFRQGIDQDHLARWRSSAEENSANDGCMASRVKQLTHQLHKFIGCYSIRCIDGYLAMVPIVGYYLLAGLTN